MRLISALPYFAALAGLAAWAGCSDGQADTLAPSFHGGVGGSSDSTSGPGTLGVGEECANAAECRAGLLCSEESVCEPGHATAEGVPCTISAECADGLYCQAVCAPAGAGTAGSGCASDADCASGFRCALAGLGATCVAEGTGDVGGACSLATDCYGGLICRAGSCEVPDASELPFGPFWLGAECPEEAGDPVEAHFRVPRGTDDGDFYRLPFPNDVRVKNGKLDLGGHPTPGASLLGYDLVQRYLDAIEAQADGFGVYQTAYFRFSGGLESGTLNDNVEIRDLTAGKKLGHQYTYDPNRNAYLCKYWVGVRQWPVEAIYPPGNTIAVLIRDGVKAKGGAPIQRSTDLAALLAPLAPADATLAAEYPKYAPLRQYLADNAINPDTILNATVFTVGNPRAVVENLQQATDAASPPVATGWTKCDAGVASPCSDATADRQCPAADADFDELHALVKLPVYQKGSAPYLEPDDGGDIALDASGAPVPQGSQDVCMSLTVPKGAAPAGGWPTVVFAHGTGGHFRSHIGAGDSAARLFAKGVDDGSGTLVKAAVLGIDQVLHGPRQAVATGRSVNDLVYNFTNPLSSKGNMLQGAADQMALLRFVPTVSLDASLTGSPVTLSTAVAFWGHSQGATEGALATPYGAWAGVVFSGQGASLIDALLTKTSPVNIAAVVPFALSEAVDGYGVIKAGRNHPVLNLLQSHMDGADPIAYARLLVKAPPTGTSPHHAFQVYGLADTYTPGVAVRTVLVPDPEKPKDPVTITGPQQFYALAAGFGLVAHDASVTTADDIGGLATIPTPAFSNLTVAGVDVSALVRQYAPNDGYDGHFVAFDLPSARGDVVRFLAGALSGKAPQVGP